MTRHPQKELTPEARIDPGTVVGRPKRMVT
jgi:hypothetical protein